MLGEGIQLEKTKKVQIYSDAWGVRKLISHVLRNLRTDRVPRESLNEQIVLEYMLGPVGCTKDMFCFDKTRRETDADQIYAPNRIPLNYGRGKLRMMVLDVWPINLWRPGILSVFLFGNSQCGHILLRPHLHPKFHR